MKKNKAIFLDRDGIIIQMHYDLDHGTIDTPLLESHVKLMPGIIEFLKAAKNKGYLLIVISNQPGIGIKKISRQNFNKIQKKIRSLLKMSNIDINREYYCFHHPFAILKKFKKRCSCRKPKIGLFKKAIRDFNLDIKKCWLVGDGVFDIIAGKKAGFKTILLANINELEYLRIVEKKLQGFKPEFLVKNLNEAREIIKKYE